MTQQLSLEFDSPEWRQVRDHKLREWVQNDDAVNWFLNFCHVCEAFDDMADRDKPISTADITTALFAALVEMPNSEFFAAHRPVLSGVIITGISAWLDANEMEKTEYPEGTRYAEMDDMIRAFSLRDWYMELLGIILYLTRGPVAMRAISLDIRRFFQAETFVEYAEKLRGRPAAPPIMEAAE